MTAPAKELWGRWLPTMVTIVGFAAQLVTFANWAGRLEQRVVANERHATDVGVHMPFEKKVEVFVLRSEYNSKVHQRDGEFAELRKAIENLSAKLDRLIERRGGE